MLFPSRSQQWSWLTASLYYSVLASPWLFLMGEDKTHKQLGTQFCRYINVERINSLPIHLSLHYIIRMLEGGKQTTKQSFSYSIFLSIYINLERHLANSDFHPKALLSHPAKHQSASFQLWWNQEATASCCPAKPQKKMKKRDLLMLQFRQL